MNKPLISVVIPCYNSQEYVAEAIDSVLRQTHDHIEIIVVDDGSTDSSYKIASEYARIEKIKLLHHENFENKGVSITRHLGVSEARGEYIALLDSDDFFEKDKIKKQVEVMESNKNCVLCHTAINLVSNFDHGLDFASHFNILGEKLTYDLTKTANFLESNRICNSSVMVRSSALKKVNFPTRQIFQYEDWALWILLSTHGEFIYLPDILLNYRYHKASSTYKTLSNMLLEQYSFVEFYLMVIAKTNDKSVKSIANRKLKNKLVELYAMYTADNEMKDKIEFQATFLSEVEQKLCEKERQLIANEWQMAEKERQLAEYKSQLAEKNSQIVEKDKIINDLVNTWSWKITKPLRRLGELVLSIEETS